ncbi:MAG: DUF1254 domain-containing protein [Mycobacteriaceae bacterium]
MSTSGSSVSLFNQDLRSAIEGYIFGYAPVVFARTRANMICALPVNQLYNQQALSTPLSRSVVAPNVDTVYSLAWLDLRDGPAMLSYPDMGSRYFGFELIDAYTNVFANVGSGLHGQSGSSFAVVPPGYSGTLPDSTLRIDSSTWDVWLIGRTLVDGPEDVELAKGLSGQYRLNMLAGQVNNSPPALPPSDCGNNPDPQTPASAGVGYFDELTKILAANPPSASDDNFLEGLRQRGIIPGAGVSTDRELALQGIREGEELIEQAVRTATTDQVGSWLSQPDTGSYGVNYLRRAVTAKVGLGANVRQESMYFIAREDSTGRALSGENLYQLRLLPNQLPPVAPLGFWSVTLYGVDMFLSPNPFQKYAIGDRTSGLVRNPDGSLDLWFSHVPPVGHQENWIPAPDGEFVLMFRNYLSTDFQWMPPAVNRQ